jgi:hypothetical protein
VVVVGGTWPTTTTSQVTTITQNFDLARYKFGSFLVLVPDRDTADRVLHADPPRVGAVFSPLCPLAPLQQMAVLGRGGLLASVPQGSTGHRERVGARLIEGGAANYHWDVVPHLQQLATHSKQDRHVCLPGHRMSCAPRPHSNRGGLYHVGAGEPAEDWGPTTVPSRGRDHP